MPATEASLPPASASASSSASDRHSVHAIALKLPEFWADNTHVWFAQTEAQFYVRSLTCSLNKFCYCVAALGHAHTAQIVDLIVYPPNELPYESLIERLTELHTLNPFQRYHVLHLGRRQEALHVDGEDVLLTSTVPQGSQG